MTIYTIDSLSIPIWTFSCCRRSMLTLVVVVSVLLEFDQIDSSKLWCLYLCLYHGSPNQF